MRHLKIGVPFLPLITLRLPSSFVSDCESVFASLLTCWPARSDVHNVHVVCVQYSGTRKYSVYRFCKTVATSVFFTWVLKMQICVFKLSEIFVLPPLFSKRYCTPPSPFSGSYRGISGREMSADRVVAQLYPDSCRLQFPLFSSVMCSSRWDFSLFTSLFTYRFIQQCLALLDACQQSVDLACVLIQYHNTECGLIPQVKKKTSLQTVASVRNVSVHRVLQC